jgi:hypothetical protein
VLIPISFYAVNMDEYTASHRLSFLQPQKKMEEKELYMHPYQ